MKTKRLISVFISLAILMAAMPSVMAQNPNISSCFRYFDENYNLTDDEDKAASFDIHAIIEATSGYDDVKYIVAGYTDNSCSQLSDLRIATFTFDGTNYTASNDEKLYFRSRGITTVKEFFILGSSLKPIADSKTKYFSGDTPTTAPETLTYLESENSSFEGAYANQCLVIGPDMYPYYGDYSGCRGGKAALVQVGSSAVWSNVTIGGNTEFKVKGFGVAAAATAKSINLYIDGSKVASTQMTHLYKASTPASATAADMGEVSFGNVNVASGNHTIKFEVEAPETDYNYTLLIFDYLSFGTGSPSPTTVPTAAPTQSPAEPTNPPLSSGEYALATDQYVRYIGRSCWETTDYGSYRAFNFPGVGFEFGFTGSKVELNINQGDPEASGGQGMFLYLGSHSAISLNVSIDGATPTRMYIESNEPGYYTVVSNIPYGYHTVRITRSSEIPWWLFIDKIRVDGSAPNPVYTVPSNQYRKMEFVGDSFTVGYSNLHECDSSYGHQECSENTDNYYSYANITARALGADANIEAYSGQGVSIACDGNNNKSKMLPAQFLRADLAVQGDDSPRPAWDFSLYTPDVICIYLGINDWYGRAYSMVHGMTLEEADNYFISEYTAFLNTIRSKYPNTKIVLISDLDTFMGRGYLEYSSNKDKVDIVYNNFAEHDSNIYRFCFNLGSGNRNNGHPSTVLDQIMADQLTPFIRQITGWN